MGPRHDVRPPRSLQRPPLAEPRLQPRIPRPPRPAKGRSRARLPRTALTLLLLPLAACGGSAAAGALATRADSAGITIITNTDASWPEGEGWLIGDAPLVQIGHRDDNDPRYDLLRVSTGRFLPDGNVIVLVAGHHQLRIYSPEGDWVRSIGREGDGPGEMRADFINYLTLARDTIFLADLRLSRISAFTATGDFLASWPIPVIDPAGRIPPSRRLADGRWLGSGLTTFTPGSVTAGLNRAPITWYRIAADFSRVEGTVAVVTGTERLITITTDGGMGITSLAISRSSPTTAGSDFLMAGDNTHPEIRSYRPDGTLSTILRWDAPAIPVDAALLERMKQAALRQADGDERGIESVEARFRNTPPAEVVPYFSGLHLDSDENIWVREFNTLPTDSTRFRVFHRDGQFLGQLALPPNLTVLDIASDRILTVWQDDDDLEYVRVYQIHR
jgi:hypothetical protein